MQWKNRSFYAFLLFLWFASINHITVANESSTTVPLTVNFPGLSGVHTQVLLPDSGTGSLSDIVVTYANWQANQIKFDVSPGVYDLRIQHGAAVHIIENVDCRVTACNINNIVSELTINFPGLFAVHADVWLMDGKSDSISDAEVSYKYWSKNKVVMPLLKGKYDVRIRQGGSALIVDGVNCTQSNCTVNNIVSTMTVDFPGMVGVHTDVWVPDGINRTKSEQEVTYNYWQSNQATLPVLRGVYDVRIRKGPSILIVDNVDCRLTTCKVTDITTRLTVNFPEMFAVHTDVWVPGVNIGAQDVDEVDYRYWQANKTSFTLLRGIYDVRVRRGDSFLRINDVNCQSNNCSVNDIVSNLTVNFPGLSDVHTDVWVPNSSIGAEEGSEAAFNYWQNNTARLTVLRGAYNIRLRKGASELVVDAIDCRQKSCDVKDIVSTLTVHFPGMTAVHADVWLPGTKIGPDYNGEVTYSYWNTDKTDLTVLRGNYDVRVRRGDSATIVKNVNCRTGICKVSDIVATLTVRFPGMYAVHSDVWVPDNISGRATGSEVNYSYWNEHDTSMTVLRKLYDVRLRHGVTSIFDNVDCTSGVCDVLVQGNSQVTLIDENKNSVIPNKHLTAYEKQADGRLVFAMNGLTNNEGKVHFTLQGINAGKVYVIKAINPLDNNKDYFSPFISMTGELQFLVSAESDAELDITPPEISISSPLDGNTVNQHGFKVTGLAKDNQRLESVLLSVNNGNTTTDIPAFVDVSNNSWSATVTSNLLNADQAIILTATATDRMRNVSSESISVTPIVDAIGPAITIASHAQQDEVPATGFLLSGTVTDQTDVQSLQASLLDPVLGPVLQNVPVEFSSNGNWTLAVQNGQISENSLLNLSLIASDESNNSSSAEINLNVVPVDNTGTHMIRRISFGATPSLLEEVEILGAKEFLEQQLSPNRIDDGQFSQRIAGMNPSTLPELQSWSLLHMIYSKRQLLEVMTWFWDNHFNTNIHARRIDPSNALVTNTVAYELRENRAFRANALGNFRQLLEISAKSPAMLIYLDSINNMARDSNENYARELLELHTLGVDGGFTHRDVGAGAEIFTGWHLLNGAFSFNASQHNSASYTVLGVAIAPGGVEQGEKFLDIVAAHPSTAKIICTKLTTVFVSDDPPASLVSRCAMLFQQTVDAPDQIAQVLALILASPEFFNPVNDSSKIKTPVEFVVGVIRNFDAQTDASDLAYAIENMGIELYQNPSPDGWSETGYDWINSTLLATRIHWVNQFVRANPSNKTYTNLKTFFPAYGFETTEGIVGFLLKLLYGNKYPDLARQQANNLLNSVNGFDLNGAEAEARLQQLTAAMLSYPQYNFQ